MKNAEILRWLDAARRAARFSDATFVDDAALNAEIKRVTRLYRDSWIIAPLDLAIAMIEADVERKRAQRSTATHSQATTKESK